MIAAPAPTRATTRAKSGAGQSEPSAAAAADRLLDQLHAFTSVAYDACDQEDVTRLESVVDQRGQVLAELEHVLKMLRTPAPGDSLDPSLDLLARRIRAFEVLEAKLVERVRRLRDDVQDALERAVRSQTGVAGYRKTAEPAGPSRYPSRSV